jgi:hypothetical protein
MTWKEMHIGIDLGLQELNSNMFGKIQQQGKDYYLNRVTVDLLLAEGRDSMGTGQIPILTPDELRNKSAFLEPYINTIKLDMFRGADYDYGELPKGFSNELSSGFLYDGVEYLVVDPSSINLSTFGGSASPQQNERFVCSIDDIVGSTGVDLPIQINGKYRIETPATHDFTQYGADNNMSGTIFISTSGGTSIDVNNCVVKPLRHSPLWSGAILKPLDNLDVLMYYGSSSNVDVGSTITSGKLIKGKTYRVVAIDGTGVISNLTSFGASLNQVGYNYMFTCTRTGVPNWNDEVTLIETKTFPNTLVDQKELSRSLDHSFGSSPDNPLCTLASGQLRVHHQSKFKVNYITLDYIRVPVKIDSILNVNSDLNVAVHGLLVDRVVQRIAGHRGQPQYQTIRAENEKTEANT